MSTFYFKYIKSEPGWKSSFMVEFLSAEFTCKDVALYLLTWALNNKPGNFVLGFIRKGFRLDWMNTSFLFSLPPNLMYLILEYSQRQEVIKRTKLFLNKEGPSRRAILKKSNDLFRGCLEMCGCTMMGVLLAFYCLEARILNVWAVLYNEELSCPGCHYFSQWEHTQKND